jgi:uncharacterized protein YndB with AHSA1/START domain
MPERLVTATPLASCERVIAAPVDVVWSMVSTADGLNRWMSVEADVDLRVGGRITWTRDSGWEMFLERLAGGVTGGAS